mgnify:CR=1 FL=1
MAGAVALRFAVQLLLSEELTVEPLLDGRGSIYFDNVMFRDLLARDRQIPAFRGGMTHATGICRSPTSEMTLSIYLEPTQLAVYMSFRATTGARNPQIPLV